MRKEESNVQTGSSHQRTEEERDEEASNMESSYTEMNCFLRSKLVVKAWFHQRITGGKFLRGCLAKYNITVGQLVLLSPLLLCAWFCIYFTFPRPNTGQSGIWAFYSVFYAFMLAFKQASVFRFLGVSWEQLVPIHHAASIVAVVLSFFHGYVAYTGHDYRPCRESSDALADPELPICLDSDEPHRFLGELRLEDNPRFRHSLIGPDPDLWTFLWDGGRNLSGSWMLTCLIALIMLSSFRFTLRWKCFDLWLAMHIAAAGAIVAYADKHRIQLFLALIVWWGLDGLLRYGLGSFIRLPKKASLRLLKSADTMGKSSNESLDNSVVELIFNHKFKYEAGQYIRIAVLETGQPVMFHPMTISSAPFEDQVTIHFRPFGGWTRQLTRMAESKQDDDQVHVLLEGPYGELSMNLFDDPLGCSTVVLVAGGIGVTPIMSLTKQLLHDHESGRRPRKLIRVVWAARGISLTETLSLIGTKDHLKRCEADVFEAIIYDTSASRKKKSQNIEEFMIDEEMAVACEPFKYKRGRPDIQGILEEGTTKL